MRLSVFLSALAVIFATAARGDDDCRCWMPDAQQIAAMEAKRSRQRLPLGSLDHYARYYGGSIGTGGRNYIWSKLVPAGGDEAPGVHIVEGMLTPLQGEGCIGYFEPGNGRWLDLSCVHPGVWTPDDPQIAELEGLLKLPGGAYPLKDYVRHYVRVLCGTAQGLRPFCLPEGTAWPGDYGAPEGGRQIIVGVFDRGARELKRGVYIGSAADLPRIFDGGCSVVTVRYDPLSKKIQAWCNGV